jgi:hypothetical protein
MVAWVVLGLSASAAHAHELQTEDRLRLVVDAETGATTALELDGANLLREAGGLLVEDFAGDSGARPVHAAAVVGAGGVVIQEAKVRPEDLRVTTTHEAQPGCIRVHCAIEDLRDEDRAMVLTYRLPVDAEGWRWGRDLVQSQVIDADATYHNAVGIGAGAGGVIDRYPFSAISGPSHGLSLAIRMDEPRVFITQYRADLRCYEIRFSLGLSQATTKFPGRADVSFVIYRHDPRWGFRSAAERYYALFPEFFEVRVQRMGGWYCNTRNNALGDAPYPYDYHFGYHECSVRKPITVAASNRMGIYTFDYTEPWFYWQLMPDEFLEEGRASVAGGIKKLKHDQDPINSDLMTRDAGSAQTAVDMRGITYDDFVRRQSRAVDNSLLWDGAGNGRGTVVSYPWGAGKFRIRFPLNLDPDIPDGAGVFLNDWIFEPSYASAEQQGCVMDGMYLDSHGAVSALLNFRREHFAFADIPLTFDPDSKRPALVNDFSAFEWLVWLTDDMHKRDRLLLTNYYHKRLFFNVIHWDAIGSEGYKRGAMLVRTLCYRKPYGDLAYGHKPKTITRLWWREYLLYATFPGQELREREAFREVGALVKREMAAGWEPVTQARCEREDILIERYGRVADGNLHLALRNSSDEPAAFTLKLEPELGLTGREIAWDLLNDRSDEMKFERGGAEVALTLLPEETTLLMIATPTEVAAGFVREARDYWADVMRVEDYANQQAVARELDELQALVAAPDAAAECVASLREAWGLSIPPHACTAGLVERAVNALDGAEIRTSVTQREESATLQATLTGVAADEVAAVEWSVVAPEGWRVAMEEGMGGNALSCELVSPQRDKAEGGVTLLLVRARVQLPDGRTRVIEQRVMRVARPHRGKLKRVLVSDDLEGEDALAGFTQRGGGSLASLPASCGIRPEAAANGERGYRLTDDSAERSVGVRTAFFEPVEAGDIVRASVKMRRVAGAGGTLYLQCWKKKEQSYTMIKTRGCESAGEWEDVVIEVQIPAGTTAITCEVFSGTSSVGVCYFDDIEFALFEPGESIYWR